MSYIIIADDKQYAHLKNLRVQIIKENQERAYVRVLTHKKFVHRLTHREIARNGERLQPTIVCNTFEKDEIKDMRFYIRQELLFPVKD